MKTTEALLEALLETTEDWIYYGYFPDGSKEICAVILLIDAEKDAKIKELTKRCEVAELALGIIADLRSTPSIDVVSEYKYFDDNNFKNYFINSKSGERIYMDDNLDMLNLFYAIAEAEYEQKAEGGGDA